MAEVTIPHILRFLSPGQCLRIFDDGSITQDDISILTAMSPVVSVITLAERNKSVQELIGNRPNCQKYRSEFPLAFKLLDLPLLAMQETKRFTFTDSDIIYIKNCREYFSRTVNTYLQTDAIKLSVKLSSALIKYKWKIPMNFNSGYFSFDLSGYDLDFLEYYLGLADVRNMPWLSEQTAWAILFGKAGNSFSPVLNEFVCRERFDGPKEDTFAIHLIAGYKKMYGKWGVFKKEPNIGRPSFFLSRNVNKTDWFKKTLRRLVK
jgi:hypothetical protein